MGMNISSGSGGDPEPMMEMNMTPMIDVMLVLIIMFITTLPIANHAVNLNMPNNTPTAPPPVPPVVMKIDVDFDGTMTWNGEVVNRTQLEAKLSEAAAMNPQPEVHLQPNRLVSYKSVAAVMAAAQTRGITKLGMIGNEQFLKN
ncbi:MULTISPECIES: ExbD/TolR family protein [Undibacterium]|jgi:biopolymer transport protein ExbD|uniref:Biopolymer transporter ExbD n=2 Tax=Undibacterium TaxID=401469 RepID=A0A941I2P9_9BURK|nr:MULTISPECIES: biopolymer transporter ExbD [Undibacterium]MBR7746542.1 biopolymer transporter ExbD [Undibacterium baiyunense]GGX05082.1 biopolymer transporter ExbD [Undibacterium macrobrachii]